MLALILHLEELASGGKDPEDKSEGLCFEVKRLFGGESLELIWPHIYTWTKHSGNPMFPVPCQYGGDPKLRYVKSTNLWKNSQDTYRRELCAHVASEMRRVGGSRYEDCKR